MSYSREEILEMLEEYDGPGEIDHDTFSDKEFEFRDSPCLREP